jgi:hypothetical protein
MIRLSSWHKYLRNRMKRVKNFTKTPKPSPICLISTLFNLDILTYCMITDHTLKIALAQYRLGTGATGTASFTFIGSASMAPALLSLAPDLFSLAPGLFQLAPSRFSLAPALFSLALARSSLAPLTKSS